MCFVLHMSTKVLGGWGLIIYLCINVLVPS